VPLIFSALAVIAAVSNWRADHVEARRRLRAFILVAGVIYTVAMLAVRVASPSGRLSDLAAFVDVVALLIIIAVAARYLLHLSDTPLVAAAPLAGRAAAEQARQPDPAEERLSEALQRLMGAERSAGLRSPRDGRGRSKDHRVFRSSPRAIGQGTQQCGRLTSRT
jgi:hypothetical protein